jgi:hypothetical protein
VITMCSRVDEKLRRLIRELDVAILQAVENPLLFCESPVLELLADSCASVGAVRQSEIGESYSGAVDRKAAEALVWSARARAGRLRCLLDAASQFYATCFSPAVPDALAYSVHGEWNATAGPSYLTVDC